MADTLQELQAQIDEFDLIYNTQRPHQSLPGRSTPQQAWDATPRADPPRPREMPPIPIRTITTRPNQPEMTPSQQIQERRVWANGSVSIYGIQFHISGRLAGQTIRTIETLDGVTFTDLDGTVLLERPWPTPGTTYVSNDKPAFGHPTPSPMS